MITLLGRNGSGRSTTLKSILGLVGKRTGSIMFNGNETIRMPPHTIAPRWASAICPEERGIFAS
jgi:branched-chain amino acid transport system ATP-binding protein